MTAALLGLLLGFIGSMPVAGPVALLVVRKGMKEEFDEGAALALGASMPEAIYCGLALAGFDFLFVNYPDVASASKILGSIILMVLGITFVRMTPKRPKPDLAVPRKHRQAAPFITGFAVAALNPTLMLTWSAVAAVLYTFVGAFSGLEKIMFPVGVGVGNFLWFIVMLSLMKRHQGRFSQQALAKAIKFIGVAILIFGLWMLTNAILEVAHA